MTYSLHDLYIDALSRIEKRERAALAPAVIHMAHGTVPAPYRRREIRAFYSKLKAGLYADYTRTLTHELRDGRGSGRRGSHVPSADGAGSGSGGRAKDNHPRHAQKVVLR